MKKSIFIALASLAIPQLGTTDPFYNLGFDLPNTNVLTVPWYGRAQDIFPGWQPYYGGILGFYYVGDAFWISLRGDWHWPWPPQDPPNIATPGYLTPFVNNYWLDFFPWRSDPQEHRLVYSPLGIQQTGDIPADANSVQFTAIGHPFQVLANGQPIGLSYELVYNGGFTAYSVWQGFADLRGWAGQNVTLSFVTTPGPGLFDCGLDNISFSSRIVPEPAMWALLAFGGVALWGVRFRRR